GRPAELADVERTVGLFLNTLPVRAAVPERQAIGEWLRGLQQQEAEARQHEYASLTDIQGWSGITPLFESVVVFENYPVGDRQDGEREAGLRLKRIRAWERTNYPLTLVVAPGARLRLRMSYQEERFADAAIEQLLDQLERALLGLAGPGSVGDVDI
uniref:condensation domain-containing protein n=1 Tax=Mesorhizobium mediterraneum TaxID=43617 RepID=UPI001AEF08D7